MNKFIKQTHILFQTQPLHTGTFCSAMEINLYNYLATDDLNLSQCLKFFEAFCEVQLKYRIVESY